MLGGVRQMRAAVLHLGDLRVRIVRVGPVRVRALLLAGPVEPGQLGARRRREAERLGQPGQKCVVALTRIPPHDAPHRRIGFQRRGIDADRAHPRRDASRGGRGQRDRLQRPLAQDAIDGVPPDDVSHLVRHDERQLVAAVSRQLDQRRRHEDVAAGQGERVRLGPRERRHLEAVRPVPHAADQRCGDLVEQRLHPRVDRPAGVLAHGGGHVAADRLLGPDRLVVAAGRRRPHPPRLAELLARHPPDQIRAALGHAHSLAL